VTTAWAFVAVTTAGVGGAAWKEVFHVFEVTRGKEAVSPEVS
jgi:hypothetical protein